MFVVSLPHWPLFFMGRGGIACCPLRLQSHQNRAPSESIATARTWAVFARVRWSPEISQIEKDDPRVRVIVTQGGAIAKSRTYPSSRNAPSRSFRQGQLRRVTNVVPALSQAPLPSLLPVFPSPQWQVR